MRLARSAGALTRVDISGQISAGACSPPEGAARAAHLAVKVLKLERPEAAQLGALGLDGRRGAVALRGLPSREREPPARLLGGEHLLRALARGLGLHVALLAHVAILLLPQHAQRLLRLLGDGALCGRIERRPRRAPALRIGGDLRAHLLQPDRARARGQALVGEPDRFDRHARV